MNVGDVLTTKPGTMYAPEGGIYRVEGFTRMGHVRVVPCSREGEPTPGAATRQIRKWRVPLDFDVHTVLHGQEGKDG